MLRSKSEVEFEIGGVTDQIENANWENPAEMEELWYRLDLLHAELEAIE